MELDRKPLSIVEGAGEGPSGNCTALSRGAPQCPAPEPLPNVLHSRSATFTWNGQRYDAHNRERLILEVESFPRWATPSTVAAGDQESRFLRFLVSDTMYAQPLAKYVQR